LRFIHFELEFFQNGVRPGVFLPWINKLRRITRRAVFAPAGWYDTAGGEERLFWRVAQRNEAPPAEFLYSVEEDVPQRVAPAVVGTPQRREFPGEQTVRLLLRRYSKYAEHLYRFCAFSCSRGQGCNTVYIPC
jgi:hypothetical protein